MNYSLLSILLIGAFVILVICSIMILFFRVRFLSFNEYKKKDKRYKYGYNHLAISIMKGIIELLFIPAVVGVILDKKNNNTGLFILLILYIVAWIILTAFDFLLDKTYKLQESKEKESGEKNSNFQKSNFSSNYKPFILLIIFAFLIILLLCVNSKMSLEINAILIVPVVLFLVLSIILSRRKRITKINITILNIISICCMGILLGLVGSLSIKATTKAAATPATPNKLSKEVDDLKKSNHKLEGKLEQEEEINQQNKKYSKKTVNKNYKTNIYIKSVTNSTINRIIKNKPHDPHTPTKKSPSPKKPPYQDPKGKLPNTGEAKGFWQW